MSRWVGCCRGWGGARVAVHTDTLVTVSDQRICQPSKPAHTLADIERIRDPLEQARSAEEFAAYAEARAKDARRLRDAALRRAKETSGLPLSQVSERTGINFHTVKAVTR